MNTVKDLREELQQEFGYSVEQTDKFKGRSALEEELKKVENAAVDVLEDLEPVNEETYNTVPHDEDSVYDEDGRLNREKLLDKLTDEEKVNGHPTVNGLRRLINDYVGWIQSNTSKVVQCPTGDNNNRATVEVEVEIHFPAQMSTTVCGCADVCSDNTMHPFNKHPVATAESRAEGRAYRKALNLNISTAEEMGHFTETVDVEPIKDAQVKMINNVCKRCDIDLEKFLAKHNLDSETLSKASDQDGQNMCRQLSEYQSLNEIPEDIKKDV